MARPRGKHFAPELDENKPPIKPILLAVFLFLIGSVMLIIGCLLVTGIIITADRDRGYALVVLGSITFIPGAYHVRIAYYAWKGYKGYEYSAIPKFD
eukprot:TRINITY_DN720_c0_g2_i2.p1 TRINITY_DN720_c0_g2~~TRINITY_DN720_c0_g2_i2.p1  ORF type:complete len:111 (-),score=7.55 TRINITY_DN720_c0_g2_i2:265-555(-)